MAPKAEKKVEKKEPKAKKEKVPGEKRAASPFIVFCNEKRPEIKAKNPEATFGEMGKLLGTAWKALSDSQKAVSFMLFFVAGNPLLTVTITPTFF